MNSSIQKALLLFSENQGMLRTSEALAWGIAPRTLYNMLEDGLIRRISRGFYQLADRNFLGNPDLVTVALRIPQAVICLVSALHFYGLTTQIPHQVDIALPAKSEKPRLEHPPLRIFWLSTKPYLAGTSTQEVDEIPIKVYSLEKTIADCFKFRKRIGLDVAQEALKEYVKLPDRQINELLLYAQLDQVEKIVRTYLEILL
jgi:predicted transcriptional regulator of viral defense system